MKTYLALLLLIISINFSFAQSTYTSNGTGGGAWNTGATWTCTGTCALPTPTTVLDDVIIVAGDIVTTPFFFVGNCRNITLDANTAGSLTMTFSILNISGTLFCNNAVPTVAVISDSNGTLNFTGANTGFTGNPFVQANDIIAIWNSFAPLPACNFNLAAAKTISSLGGAVTIAGAVNVNSGTLQQGQFITGLVVTGSNTFTIANGATLNLTIPLSGGASSSNINSLAINGTFTTTNYVNTSNFSMGANSAFLTSYSSGTEGWWHDNSALPTFGPMNSSSTLTYSSAVNQAVADVTYGNLVLSGAGTKTGGSTGTLKTLGDLTIANNSVTFITTGNPQPVDIGGNLHNDGNWSSDELVFFNGSALQSITGNNVTTFNGGIRIGNTSNTVQLNSQDIDVNGVFTIDVGATFSPNGRQVDLNSNMVVDGTLIASGTFDFNGTTTVTGSGTASFENLIVTNTLFSPTQTVRIAGDLTNNGTFTNFGGTVILNGATPQTLSGTLDLYNFDISNTGGITAIISNNGTLNLNTELTMAANTTFDADGSGSGLFTVKSISGSNAARVSALPSGASIDGNVTVERYFNGAGNVWRNFGTSVNGATVAQITNAGLDLTSGNGLAYYDETDLGIANDLWVTQATFGANIDNNKGYSMWTYAADLTTTISFSGTLNQGTQSMPITYSNSGNSLNDGWNLVNNPFPSTIDWDGMTRNGSVDGVVSVWNTASSVYDTWNGTTGSLSGGLIASGQAFWVQTNGASPTLSIPESAKNSGAASFLRTSGDPISNHIIVSLRQDDKVDKTYIHFRDDATIGFDNQLDGRKRENGIFNLSTLAEDGADLSINSLPMTGCNFMVPLNITNIDEGAYELKFDDLQTFESAFEFTLIDNFLSSSSTIEDGAVFGFDVTSDPASYGDERFLLQLAAATLDTNVLYEVTDVCDFSSSLTITNAQIGVDYTLVQNGIDMVAKKAISSTLVLPLAEDQVVEGLNTFDLNMSSGECSSPELIVDAIEFTINAVQEISSITDGENCGAGQVLLSVSGATGNAYYNWYESFDSTDPILNQNSDQYLTPILESDKFYYVSITNEAGCESTERAKVSASIKSFPSTDILYKALDLCDPEPKIKITNAEIGATYNLLQNGQIVEFGVADDSELVIVLNDQQVIEGANLFDLRVELAGCSSDVTGAVSFEYYSIKEITSVANGKECTANNVVLNAEGASSGGHYNWYESMDAVDPITGENASEFISPELEETRSYFVSIVNANGCESLERIEVIAEIVNLEQPEIALVEDVISTTIIADTYTWYKDGVVISEEVGQSIVVVESGIYSVEIESNGCSIQSVELPVTILAIKELEELGVSIYPNPVVDVLTINGNKGKIKSIIIYDTKGVAVFRSGNKIPNEINLISIKKGIYIINIATDNKTINYRVRKK